MTRKPADLRILILLFLKRESPETFPWNLSDQTEKSNCNQNLLSVDERRRADCNKRARRRSPAAVYGKDANRVPGAAKGGLPSLAKGRKT
jgi:hypothetical protein